MALQLLTDCNGCLEDNSSTDIQSSHAVCRDESKQMLAGEGVTLGNVLEEHDGLQYLSRTLLRVYC